MAIQVVTLESGINVSPGKFGKKNKRSPIYNLYLLVSVRLWNFKDGGSQKVRFLAKNQHATKEKSLKNP